MLFEHKTVHVHLDILLIDQHCAIENIINHTHMESEQIYKIFKSGMSNRKCDTFK